MVPLCATWSGGLPEGGEDEDVLLKLAKLLCTLATEIMDSLKKVENGEGRGRAGAGAGVGWDAFAGLHGGVTWRGNVGLAPERTYGVQACAMD